MITKIQKQRRLLQIFAEDKHLEGLPINEICVKWLERIKPILERYWELLGSITANGGSNLEKAVNYSLNNKKELEVFLLDGRLELTNNRAERAVKPFVMGRKNWLFADTDKGSRRKHDVVFDYRISKAE